jgi:hypothetical protein
MDSFAERVLKYVDDDGNERDLVLKIGKPHMDEETGDWICSIALGPPLNSTERHGAGVDPLQALLTALAIARVEMESSRLKGRVNWGGMADCGLPDIVKGGKLVLDAASLGWPRKDEP